MTLPLRSTSRCVKSEKCGMVEAEPRLVIVVGCAIYVFFDVFCFLFAGSRTL